jgi:hypothetical protein
VKSLHALELRGRHVFDTAVQYCRSSVSRCMLIFKGVVGCNQMKAGVWELCSVTCQCRALRG